jgi:hypothetical protein
MSKTVKLTKQEVQKELWKRGELSWLLYDYQRPVYKALRSAMERGDLKFVLNISRRFGKSTILSLLAIEQALKKPKSQIRYAAPTGKELKKAIMPIMGIFFDTAPPEIKPKFNSQDMAYVFPNGSMIHLAGVNAGHEDDLRGTAADLIIVDEAAQIDNLEYLVQSVLMPQTLTTDAITIMASTPAVTQDHDFYTYYIDAEIGGWLAEYTVHDNTSLSKKKVKQIMEDCGGENSTTWKREYLAQWVQDANLDIIPEWDDKYIKKWERDDLYYYYHKYVAMDIGVVDKTAILYGFYDFPSATFYVQSEDSMEGHELTTDKIAKAVTIKERDLWESQTPYRRVSDNNNLILLQDLSHIHGMFFKATNKDSLDAMVNEVRMFVKSGRLIVDPSCKQLIGCLRHGIWKKSKTKREFGRSKTLGHMDALAALVYLIRNLDVNENPIPAELGINKYDSHINKELLEEQHNRDSGTSNNIAELKKVLG